jgi:MFS family permease
MLRNAEMQEENRGYALFHGDGLLDIFVGLGILLFGAGMLVEMPWLVAVFPATLWPVWQDIKKSLTAPRLERAGVAPTPETEQNKRLAMMSVIGVLVLSLGVGVSFFMIMGAAPSAAQVWLRQHFAVAFGVFLAVMIGTVGRVFRAGRYYAYAAVILASFAAAQWSSLSLPIATVISGAAILLAGLGVLIRFVRMYPAQGENR